MIFLGLSRPKKRRGVFGRRTNSSAGAGVSGVSRIAAQHRQKSIFENFKDDAVVGSFRFADHEIVVGDGQKRLYIAVEIGF